MDAICARGRGQGRPVLMTLAQRAGIEAIDLDYRGCGVMGQNVAAAGPTIRGTILLVP